MARGIAASYTRPVGYEIRVWVENLSFASVAIIGATPVFGG